jgi:peptide/nickel transport system permease protein
MTPAVEIMSAPARTIGRFGWRRAAVKRRSMWIATTVLAIYIFLAIFGSFVSPFDPNQQSLTERLASPSWHHLVGTDSYGRDELSRLIAAARIDLPVGLLGAVVPCLIGIVLGTIGGYIGGIVDTVVMRLADLVMAFPIYVLIIVLVGVLGPGVRSVILAFAFVGWIPYARLVRTEILRVKAEDYVAAAYLGGLGSLQIVTRYILRNSLAPVVTYVVLDVMFAVLTLASFSFLGLGIRPPTAEWGSMIAQGQAYLQTNWWLTVAPGVMVAGLGYALVTLGEVIDERRGG